MKWSLVLYVCFMGNHFGKKEKLSQIGIKQCDLHQYHLQTYGHLLHNPELSHTNGFLATLQDGKQGMQIQNIRYVHRHHILGYKVMYSQKPFNSISCATNSCDCNSSNTVKTVQIRLLSFGELEKEFDKTGQILKRLYRVKD